MVVGAAGAGKSTFLQWLAVCAAQGSFPVPLADWNRLIPFFIRLRDYQGQGFPAPEAFADKITPMGSGEMPDGWVREVLRRGDAPGAGGWGGRDAAGGAGGDAGSSCKS